MRAPDEIFRREGFGLARAGAAAPHVDPRRPILPARKYGHTGLHPLIGGVPDRETGHVRDEIPRAGAIHGGRPQTDSSMDCVAIRANPCRTRSGTICPAQRMVPVIIPASPPVMNSFGLMPVLCSMISAARSAMPARANTAPRDTAPMVLFASTPAREGVLCSAAFAMSLVPLISASRIM